MADTSDDAAVVATYLQGQVFELNSLPVLGSRTRSMHPVAKLVAEKTAGTSSTLLVPVKIASGRVMLVTQTCDLQTRRTERGQTLVHVAPVVELEGENLRNARRDARPNYIAVPWLGGSLFADMDQMAAVDRGVLVEAPTGPRPSESDRRDLAYRLGRYFSRPALPDEVLDVLKPLQKFAEAKHFATRRVRDAVAQVRVFPNPDFAKDGPWSLRVTLVVDAEWLSDVDPKPFRETGKQFQDVTEPMTEIFDRAEPSERGQLLTLWGRLCKQLRERLTDKLRERAAGKYSDVLVDVVSSLTPADLASSDVLDFGNYSLDD